MNVKNIKIILVVLFLFPSCISRITVTPPVDEVRNRQDKEFLKNILDHGRNGDWFIIRGYHGPDHLIAGITAAPLSHSGVLDMDKKEVVESIAQGVVRTKLNDFIHKSHRIILIRPKWSKGKNGDRAIAKARKLVGSKYDFLGLVGLNSKKRFYCTELCMHVYSDFYSKNEHIPKVIEPVQMYLWGTILYDSRSRD